MANGVHLGLLLLCLIHAASVSGLLRGQARLFQRQDGGADGGPKAPPQPQDQLRQSVQSFSAHGRPQSGGGYVHTLSQKAQYGRPASEVTQSRPQPRPSWQAAKVPEKAAGSSRQATQQAEARREKPSAPLNTATLFIDGVYVQMQTSARGRARKVLPGSSSMPARFTSLQGRWLQGRYKAVPEDGQPGDDHHGGQPKSKFFNSAVPVPGAQNQPRRRLSGSPALRYAPTEVHEIPEHLGGFAIKRLKPQRLVYLQQKASPRMPQGAWPGSTQRRDGGWRM